MVWIESHPELVEHPKTHVLSAELGLSVPHTIGILHMLWYFAVRFSWQKGDLTRFGAVAIARACHWDKNAGELIKALQNAGFLDGLKVHDWHDFAGRLVKDRIRYQKANGIRKESRRNPAVSPPVSVANHTVPDLTIPNHTNQHHAKVVDKSVDNFDVLWKRYPNKDGKKAAERHFKSSVKTEKDWIDIQKALVNYLQSDPVRNGFVKNASTWFNNWQDWINFNGKTGGKYDASNGGQGVSEYAAIARAAREAAGLGKIGEGSERTLLDRFRNNPDVPAKAKDSPGD